MEGASSSTGPGPGWCTDPRAWWASGNRATAFVGSQSRLARSDRRRSDGSIGRARRQVPSGSRVSRLAKSGCSACVSSRPAVPRARYSSRSPQVVPVAFRHRAAIESGRTCSSAGSAVREARDDTGQRFGTPRPRPQGAQLVARDAFRGDALVGYRHRRMFGKGASSGPTPPTSPSSAACAASVVRYFRYPGVEPGLAHLPWVAGSPTTTGIVGHLFYCDNQNVWEERQLPRVRILRRAEPRRPAQQEDPLADATQRRGVAALAWRQARRRGFVLPAADPGRRERQAVPSIVNVPTAGRWRPTLVAGTRTGHVTVIVLPGHTS